LFCKTVVILIMSMKVQHGRRKKLIYVLSDVLDRVCERNDTLMVRKTPITRFQASRTSQIKIKFYLERVAKYTRCSEECLVLSLIYIDRLIRMNQNFLVTFLNVHRLIITGIMLGAKFFDDKYFNSTLYGKVGGISRREMNLLELEFLRMLSFELFVETRTYDVYNERLMSRAQSMEQKLERHRTTSVVPDCSTTKFTQLMATVKSYPSVACTREFCSIKYQNGPSRMISCPTPLPSVRNYGHCATPSHKVVHNTN